MRSPDFIQPEDTLAITDSGFADGDAISAISTQSRPPLENDVSDYCLGNFDDGFSVRSWTLDERKPSNTVHLLPIFIRFSARVHHIHFIHPSLPANPRIKPNIFIDKSAKGTKQKPKIKKKKKKKNQDSLHEYGKDESDQHFSHHTNSLVNQKFEEYVSLCVHELKRLSRDGIIRDHKKIQDKILMQSTEETHDTTYERIHPMGRRDLIVASFSPYDRNEVEATIPSLLKRNFTKKQMSSSSMEQVDSATDTSKCDEKKSDLQHDLLYSGKGFEFVGHIRNNALTKMGRFLPNTACFVPKGGVYFNIINEKKVTTSTSPFVVNAPHTLWGSGRDYLLHQACLEGNPLVDLKNIEYVPDHLLGRNLNKRSLLVMGTTIWVRTDDRRHIVGNNGILLPSKQTLKVAKYGAKMVKKGAKGAMRRAHLSHKNKSKKTADNRGIEENQPALSEDTQNSNSVLTTSSPIEKAITSNEVFDSHSNNSKTIEKDMMYHVEHDDTLKFQVLDFESGKPYATFPISVASVLNARTSENFNDDPRNPGEVTLVLAQDANPDENKWGIEVKVTFRCAEVIKDPNFDQEPHEVVMKYLKKMAKLDQKLQEKASRMNRKQLRKSAEAKKLVGTYLDQEQAIVNSGIGRGFEHGAPMKSILERQILYDEECENDSIARRKRTHRTLTTHLTTNLSTPQLSPDDQFEDFFREYSDALSLRPSDKTDVNQADVNQTGINLSKLQFQRVLHRSISARNILTQKSVGGLLGNNYFQKAPSRRSKLENLVEENDPSESETPLPKKTNEENDDSESEQSSHSQILSGNMKDESKQDLKQNEPEKKEFTQKSRRLSSKLLRILRVMVYMACMYILYKAISKESMISKYIASKIEANTAFYETR